LASPAALALADVDWPQSSLYDLEFHARTYAGHTVWGQKGDGQRRRPRADWTIRRDAHPALISDTEAEAILFWLS
jgi:hypothetical protein